MSFEHIESRQNHLVKELRRLADNKRARLDAGLVLCEGDHLLRTMLDAGARPKVIAMATRAMTSDALQGLLARCDGARIVTVADAVFDQIAPADSPVGVLALASMPTPIASPDTGCDALVLESVQDPGNVGSLIRTAVAAGVKQIVLSPGCADVWSPRCLRAAQGAQWLARIYADADPLPFLQRYQGDIAATILEGGHSLYEHAFKRPVAWLFGNEGQGLSQALINCANYRITIPMPGMMESLNVNAAAAVCLFEQVRQRSLTA